MTELNFKVDESKCIHCGLCEKDCIAYVIRQSAGNLPKAINPEKCIKCGHCMAICPVGAISIFNKNPDNSEAVYTQNPEMILNLIKSRRSNRLYKKENVDKETLNKLKDMLKWVPTGCNAHSLHFSFIDDIRVMNEFRDYTNRKILNILNNKGLELIVDKFSPFIKHFLDGEDIIFREAPHLIVAANKVTAPCAKQDAIIALSYFELYAQSLGLGTCWCGFADIAIKAFPELIEFLKIPDGYQVEYVMLFGYKNAVYQRTTQNEDVSIVSAGRDGIQEVSIFSKIKRYFWNMIR